MASATIRRRATLLTAMDQNCATPRFRGQRDALVQTPHSLCTCFLAVVQTNMPRWSHKRASNGRNVGDDLRTCSPFLSWRIQNLRRLPVWGANNVERHRLEHAGVGTLEFETSVLRSPQQIWQPADADGDAPSLVSRKQVCRGSAAGLFLEIDESERLPVMVADYEARSVVVSGPRWREGASSHHRGYANESPAGAGAGLRQGLSGG